MIKALTIWQPWASLIIVGAKPFEFRGWRAPQSMIGQRIVIHAGARPMRPSEIGDLIRRLDGDDAWITGLLREQAMPLLLGAETQVRGGHRGGLFDDGPADFEPLPYSAGIGTAIIGANVSGDDAAERFGRRANDSDRDEHANWGWPMLDIDPWPNPIAMRGAQGFWNWPEPKDAGL